MATTTRNQQFQLGLFGKGLLSGLFLGMLLSAVIAWMVGSRGGVSSVGVKNTEVKQAGQMPTNTATEPTRNSNNRGAAGEATNAPQQFDFYRKDANIAPLPPVAPPLQIKGAPVVNDGLPNVAPTTLEKKEPPKDANAGGASKNGSPMPNTPPERPMMLSTRAYQKISEVESIKARLAIMGFEPKVLVGQGAFSLQLGPYPSAKALAKAKKDLGAEAGLFSVQ